MMRNLEVMINEQRRSSVHLDMEKLEKNHPIEKALHHSTERRNRKSGVNCSFAAYYGRKSPVAKRRREDDKDDQRSMKTFDTDPTDDPTYESETLVLSEITEIVKEKEMIDLINKFSPVIRNFPDQIKKEMLESTVDWVERKNIFIETIKYVIKGREDEPNKKSELEEASIERLSEILIREIENRMPKYCRKCDKYYKVKPTDCPQLHCMLCKVGMHDCIKMSMMKDRPGIKWLCEICEPKFNTHYLPKFDSAAIFEGFETHKPHNKANENTEKEKEIKILVSQDAQPAKPKTVTVCENEVEILANQETVQPTNPIRISKRIEMEQKEMDKIQVVAEVHRTENETGGDNGTSNQPLTQKNSNNNIDSHDGSGSPTNYRDVMKYPNINKEKICRFLTRGLCRYGAKGENELGKCRRPHPSQCKKYNENGITENGCKEGNKCHNWHATYICRSSADKNLCSRINCWYKHHKNCKTTENNDDHDMNSFLAYNQHKLSRQYQGPQPSRYHKKQSHQHHYRSQRPVVNHQRQQMHMGQGLPIYNQQYNNQLPQVSEDRLVYLIRSILREETNNY